MEYLTKIYMMMWENRKVILTFPTIKGEIQQWKNPMENTENPTKIRLQLIFNGKRAHRRI